MCLQGSGGKADLQPVAKMQVIKQQGSERFENEEGVLQGVEFLLERRVCVVVRARGGQAREP